VLDAMRILALALAFILSACAATPPVVVKPVVPQDAAACKAAGGNWTRLGIPCEACEKRCDLKTTDSGKRCTDSNQCQGSCVASGESSTSGKCAAYVFTFSCYYYMQSGKARQICVD